MKLIKIVSAIILLAAIPCSAFFYFNSAPAMMRDEVLYIREGESLRGVARRLKEQNLIESEKFFLLLAGATGKAQIQTGKYRVERGATSQAILKKFVNGDILKRRVTIPEGFNIYQIAERLEKSEVSKQKEFIYFSEHREFLKSIGIDAPSAEGYLFPDTYVFPEESNPRAVIKTMYDRLHYVLGRVDLSNMNRLGLDAHKLLTLASMIEKEAKVASERGYVSAVFHNRLKKGMKLDCDPTVRYAVKRFTGPIYLRDLQSASPYNTYVSYGLPPTPICSPGRESIIAALNPRESDFIYFVARNDGSHYFSRTLAEHNRAVLHYQRGKKENGFVDNQRL